MKYDCDLIRDIAPLYKDGALSERSAAVVAEHLSECEGCRKYYDEFSDDKLPAALNDDDAKRAADYGGRIAAYRAWQTGIFGGAVAALFTMLFPWFGHRGIAEIAGTAVLRNPLALTGITLFMFAVWYSFKGRRSRQICGYIGWGLWLFSELYEYLTIPMGSTVGIQWGPVSLDIPSLAGFSITSCLQNALPGFYIGVAALLAVGAAFRFFVRKTSLDMA